MLSTHELLVYEAFRHVADAATTGRSFVRFKRLSNMYRANALESKKPIPYVMKHWHADVKVCRL